MHCFTPQIGLISKNDKKAINAHLNAEIICSFLSPSVCMYNFAFFDPGAVYQA